MISLKEEDLERRRRREEEGGEDEKYYSEKGVLSVNYTNMYVL